MVAKLHSTGNPPVVCPHDSATVSSTLQKAPTRCANWPPACSVLAVTAAAYAGIARITANLGTYNGQGPRSIAGDCETAQILAVKKPARGRLTVEDAYLRQLFNLHAVRPTSYLH